MSFQILLPRIDLLESDGAVVILKWDGERKRKKKTVIITKPETDFLFRIDHDNLEEAISLGIKSYNKEFNKNI